MIEIKDLHKSFGKVTAVDGLDVRAADGEITGLIGPNGAGKTTTFRIIAGLLQADRGAALVDGKDTAAERIEAQRRLGVLPDVRGLYMRLTGREHVRYHGRLHDVSGPVLEDHIEELITRLEMTDFADRRAKGYSRGQELKVALARAMVHSPHNLILDEPTNGLDVVSSRAVRALLGEMRDDGACILIASHNLAEISALCDRLFIIAHGRIVISGTPDELRAHTHEQDFEDMIVSALATGEQ